MFPPLNSVRSFQYPTDTRTHSFDFFDHISKKVNDAITVHHFIAVNRSIASTESKYAIYDISGGGFWSSVI